MTTKLQRRMARQLYDAGFALFQECNYEQAIAEVRKAEDAFRELDARGHPFGLSLTNGVSGLANALALEGRCCQKLGDYRRAVTCYESSLINAKFEKKRPFHLFWSAFRNDVISCYEKELEKADPETLRNLKKDPAIDISFVFPFSLPQELIPVARLYELTPERYPHFRDFHTTTKKMDLNIRRMDKRSDESTMKKLSIFVWGILVSIWVAYGLIVVRALIRNK